jgi:PAS domain S-box-containing protein
MTAVAGESFIVPTAEGREMSVPDATGGPLTSRAGSPWRLRRYGLAAILAGLAVLTSLVLSPHWSPRPLLLPGYPAVILSAWYGGFGAGLFTTLLSALAITYLHQSPTHSLMIGNATDFTGFLLFLSVGLVVSALNARLLDARDRAETVSRGLEREIDQRRTVEAVATKIVTIADELQTSVEFYRQQLWSLAGVFRAQRDGRIVACSDLFVLLLGATSSEQVQARGVRDLFLDPAQWQELAASLTSGVIVSNQELRWRRNDGTPLTVRASLRETDGLVEGIVIDITDRKRSEEANRLLTRIEEVLEAAGRVQEIRRG